MKILHVLDHYKPHFSGYVFRTDYILKYQKEFGINPAVVTSPKHGHIKAPVEEIDGVTVYRTVPYQFGNVPFLREWKLINSLERRINEAVGIEKPDIIHAHSPSLNGIAALRVGRKQKIPVAYEVRAFWEDAAVDHGTFKENSFKYRTSRIVETAVLSKVQTLFTICEGLKNEIVSRGIPENKIHVIPNCVDLDIFVPEKYDQEIADRYGLRGNVVFGFIGSFYYYEGLDILLESYMKLHNNRNDVKLLLVGDGPAKKSLYERAKQMELNGRVIFTGQVPHKEIKRYYSVIDVLLYPRKKMRLTDLVTPLKPLEAMAMGRVIAGSDVGGLRELITHNKNGYLFKADSIQSLLQKMKDIYGNSDNFETVSKAARKTVEIKHNWKPAVRRYISVYERLLSGRR